MRTYFLIRSPRLLLFTLAALALLAAACQGTGAPQAPTLGNTPSVPPAASPTPDLRVQEAQAAWKSGPHAAAYDLGKGPNTYCARCHSPANWDPAARPGAPPNCVSCKFATDATVRVAPTNPLVPEQDWKGIACATCHTVDQGTLTAQLGWKNVQTGYTETVAVPSDLCKKCHADTATLRHSRGMSGTVHPDYDCLRCHDPHSTQASCTSSGCHEAVVKSMLNFTPDHASAKTKADCLGCHPKGMQLHSMEINQRGIDDCLSCHGELLTISQQPSTHPGHDTYHKAITCAICHDASGATIARSKDGKTWTTTRTFELLGRKSEQVFVSHNLQRAVTCTRCHFAGNPWGLKEDISGALR